MRLNATDLLFITALEETAGLGVEVLVAAMKYVSLPRGTIPDHGSILPLDGPVHSSVGKDEGRGDVEDLAAETAESVEDGSVEGTGEGTLAVSRESVGRDALGGRAACRSIVLVASLPL
jgi:hypothetical protein